MNNQPNLTTLQRVTLSILIALLLTPCVVSQEPKSFRTDARWWKGNLHTHSLWSDGDQFPEMIADWYRSKDYQFLALTDHNVLSQGMRWMPMNEVVKRSDEGILSRYRERFGDAWVETRGDSQSDDYEVRLKPLDEFRYLLEEAGKFILIPAEEISDKAEGKPIHINATNLAEAIAPQGGETVRQTIENNLRAIIEHGKEHGREVLPHLNHPNFFYGVSAEDIATVVSEQFFEVYNGHPGVNHLGDEHHPSVEKLWDIANTIRLGSLHTPPLFGVATDDSHEYHGQPGSHPGRGWVMVRSHYLTPEHLIRAMKQGDFYASSGVSLTDVHFDVAKQTLAIQIDAQNGVNYQTDFIASLHSPEADTPEEMNRVGVVVASSKELSPRYTLKGNELYVRAVITSSEAHSDPSFANQQQQAWTQPIGWRDANETSTQPPSRN
ncbi:hypothetical protein Pla22_39120 [Rubripirellula amarantea]|uniref:PHP domain protein n=1 Tax=Rubripirellula amarantea TaxID=2527999 RepID=A0A5C5WLU1_9BACT|nr:PHP domain-containing protein [Rubripirellula amarantea]TWT51135.1 hypothetical protein Pla22_39120 [Rubripirellula amarantea]